MVKQLRVLYFLEDRAHDNFIGALVRRVVDEEIGQECVIHHDVRSPHYTLSSGKDIVKTTFKGISAEIRNEEISFDIFIIVVDGNKEGIKKRRDDFTKQLAGSKREHPFYLEKTVFAIPDPHIEKWYLMDTEAFFNATGAKLPSIAGNKAEKGEYKNILRNSLREAGIATKLRGVEYGEDIVAAISDLNKFCLLDKGCKQFIEALRNKLRQLRQSEV